MKFFQRKLLGVKISRVIFSPLAASVRPARFAGDEGDAGDAQRVIPFFLTDVFTR
jgi:hypothetical protein